MPAIPPRRSRARFTGQTLAAAALGPFSHEHAQRHLVSTSPASVALSRNVSSKLGAGNDLYGVNPIVWQTPTQHCFGALPRPFLAL